MSDFDNSVDVIDDNAGNRIEGAAARIALEYIVKSIVDDQESVVVEVENTPNGVLLRVHVAPDDKGKVIGKRGRVAMALRTLVRAIGSREDVNISVDLERLASSQAEVSPQIQQPQDQQPQIQPSTILPPM